MNDELIGFRGIFGIDPNLSYHPDLEIGNPLIVEINKKNNIYRKAPNTNYKLYQKNYKRRLINPEYMEYIEKKLYEKLPYKLADAILGTIIEESGGDPFALSDNGDFYGILLWGKDRYNRDKDSDKNPYNSLDRQINYLFSTLNNMTDKKSWTHGGEGSGYKRAADVKAVFDNYYYPNDSIVKAFNFGYVRPTGKHESVKNRLMATNLLSEFRK